MVDAKIFNLYEKIKPSYVILLLKKDKFHSSISLSPFSGIIGGYEIDFTPSNGRQTAVFDANFHKIIPNPIGPLLGKILVGFGSAYIVGIAVDFDSNSRRLN